MRFINVLLTYLLTVNDDARKLLDEQQQDASLADCWSMAVSLS